MEFRLLVSGETEYILKEIYSGSIQQRSSDILQYNRYTFASRHCTSPPKGEIIYTHCSGIKKLMEDHAEAGMNKIIPVITKIPKLRC